MKLFRTVLFWSHLVAGLTAGVVVVIMSVTGVLLTYQRQMQYWADTRHYGVEAPAGAERLPAAQIVAAAQAVDPSTAPTTIAVRADRSEPAAVALGNRTIYVNPYTAQVLGEPTGTGLRAFFSEMVVWHRYLAMSGDSRPFGRAITGAANLLFLFIVLSGLYLWWPRSISWGQFRNVLWFRGGLRPKARNFNWHNVLGFWSALPLALVVYSGVIISYPWASNMVYRVMGEEPPAPAAGRAGGPGRAGGAGEGRGGAGRGAGEGGRGGAFRRVAGQPTTSGSSAAVTDLRAAASPSSPAAPGSQSRAVAPLVASAGVPARERGAAGLLRASEPAPAVQIVDADLVLSRAMAYEPAWTILSARISPVPAGTTTVTVDRGDGGQPHLRGTLTLGATTGDVRSWDGYSTQTAGRRARSFLRFAHTGEIGGLAGQTIAGLVSAVSVVLVYTGFALSWRRFREGRGRRRGAGEARRAPHQSHRSY